MNKSEVTINMPNGTLHIPLNKARSFESMSLNTVSVHDGKVFRLRMNHIKDRIKNKIEIVAENAKGKVDFDQNLDGTLKYKIVKLNKNGNSDSRILDLSDRSSSSERQSDEVFTLDCFAFELGASHYFIYIAGQWFISFSNPFKFFSEDYRRKDIDSISKEIKKLDMPLYISKKDADKLISEVYPLWRGFSEERLNLIVNRFSSKEDILRIITDHIEGKSNQLGFKPYDDAVVEGKIKEISKSLDSAFYRYVRLLPVWDTKERFDAMQKDMRNLELNASVLDDLKPTDDEEDEEDDENEDMAEQFLEFLENENNQTTPAPGIQLYSDISYESIKQKMGSFDDYIKSYVKRTLEQIKVMDDDINEILNTLDFNTDITISDLQDAMINSANVTPGKFELLTNIAKRIGVEADYKDPERIVNGLKLELQREETKKKALAMRRAYLVNYLTEPDKDIVMDAPNEKTSVSNEYTKGHAKMEIDLIDEELKNDRIVQLKREIHVMKDPNWVQMKDVLERAGVKAINKSAVKMNIVYTIDEFDAILTRLSNGGTINERLQKAEADLDNLVVDKGEISTKLQDIEEELDETYVNSGYPDEEADLPGLVSPLDLDSRNLFRGNKGEKIDAFIKKWMLKCPKYKFQWSNTDLKRYGYCHFDSHIVLSLPLARENPLETTYLTLLHEIAHAVVGELGNIQTSRSEYDKENHGKKWMKKAKELYKQYFKEKGEEMKIEPKQFHTYIPWKQVRQVLREKGTKHIWNVYFNTSPTNVPPGYELVDYRADEYTVLNYANIDPEFTIQKQREMKSNLDRKVSQLQHILEKGETDEMKRLKRKIDDLKELRKINYPDYDVFQKIVQHVRENVRKDHLIDDMIKLYSSSIKIVIEGDSDWLKNGKVRTVSDYMGALMALHFTTAPDDMLEARTTTRTNGIPIALRYALHLDGEDIKNLPESTFENMKKFGKIINKTKNTKVTKDILFQGKRQKGIYVDSGVKMDTLRTSASDVSKIIDLTLDELPARKMRQKNTSRITDTPPNGSNASEEPPDFLATVKAAIAAHMHEEPMSIVQQTSPTCAMHAVNNLLGTEYTCQDFKDISGEDNWWTDNTVNIMLGANASHKEGSKWIAGEGRLHLSFPRDRLEKIGMHVLQNENLVGLLFFIGNINSGHYTAMKKWSSDGFAYMDSLTASVVKLPIDQMFTYILGIKDVKSFSVVMKDEASKERLFRKEEVHSNKMNQGKSELIEYVQTFTNVDNDKALDYVNNVINWYATFNARKNNTSLDEEKRIINNYDLSYKQDLISKAFEHNSYLFERKDRRLINFMKELKGVNTTTAEKCVDKILKYFIRVYANKRNVSVEQAREFVESKNSAYRQLIIKKVLKKKPNILNGVL